MDGYPETLPETSPSDPTATIGGNKAQAASFAPAVSAPSTAALALPASPTNDAEKSGHVIVNMDEEKPEGNPATVPVTPTPPPAPPIQSPPIAPPTPQPLPLRIGTDGPLAIIADWEKIRDDNIANRTSTLSKYVLRFSRLRFVTNNAIFTAYN